VVFTPLRRLERLKNTRLIFGKRNALTNEHFGVRRDFPHTRFFSTKLAPPNMPRNTFVANDTTPLIRPDFGML